MRVLNGRRPGFGLSQSKQFGVALFISLVLLLVLTIAGVSAVQTTSLEERMARNTHDNLMAFMAAEAALREGELLVEDEVDEDTEFEEDGTDGMWLITGFGQDPVWEDPAVWAYDSATTIEADATIPKVKNQPRYMVEYVTRVVEENEDVASKEDIAPPIVHMYRITAVGVGGTENARVFLQSVYGKFLED